MCKLTKKYSSEKNPNEELEMTVDYNPETGSVDDIISFRAREFASGIVYDLTDSFSEHFSGHLDTIVSEIDWRELYREQKPAIIPAFNMVDYAHKLAATVFPNITKKAI